jgi:hypothetical protein
MQLTPWLVDGSAVELDGKPWTLQKLSSDRKEHTEVCEEHDNVVLGLDA